MKKADLKTGMTIRYRNGDRAMVLLGADVAKNMHASSRVLVNLSGKGFEAIDDYSDNLLDPCFGNYDIMEIYEPSGTGSILDFDSHASIWKRQEVKEMTLAQIEEALGYPVKLVSDAE